MQQILKFIFLVLRHGHLNHRGPDFNQLREQSLKDLQKFVPSGSVKNFSRKPGTLRNILNQLAFMTSSDKLKVGHLTVENLAYIRIPKSASTSMGKAILEKKYPALQAKSITEKQINFLTDVNLQRSVKETQVFTIVRNPFSRLVSVYKDFFENADNFIYHDYLFGVLSPGISFTEFINRIAIIPDRLKDQHIRQQSAFLKFYEEQNIGIKIFKLENTNELSAFLASNHLQLPHLNKSLEQYDYRSHFTLETLEKAQKIYASDIEKFGYETTLSDLQNHLKTVH